MADIPESLLRRSAEAKAKALGVPVEQVLAEMKGEAPPSPPPSAPEPETGEPVAPVEVEAEVEVEVEAPVEVETSAEREAEAESSDAEPAPEVEESATDETPVTPPAVADEGASHTETVAEPAVATTAVEEPPASVDTANGAGGDGSGGSGARQAAVVAARPVAPPANVPEGVRTQRLLTVVRARAIQNVKAEPQDKVNTWPHLMLAEFTALLAMTAFLLVLSVILQAPLLEPANFNATPNPSKAPWYFLGLQEMLSYFDPQIAGVTVPTIIGLIGFMMIPYVDRNPSNKPSDRKFAIMMFTIFLTGSAVLTVIGVLFRGQGFNWAYPWRDGVFFDDLKDWVHFE
jgi:menaquinol-cytochrome c reductase cytochrome b/c subunit